MFSLYWCSLNDFYVFLFRLVDTLELLKNAGIIHCVKSVRIRSFSGPHFPAFGLNTERYSVHMRENTYQKNSEYGHFSRSYYFNQY